MKTLMLAATWLLHAMAAAPDKVYAQCEPVTSFIPVTYTVTVTEPASPMSTADSLAVRTSISTTTSTVHLSQVSDQVSAASVSVDQTTYSFVVASGQTSWFGATPSTGLSLSTVTTTIYVLPSTTVTILPTTEVATVTIEPPAYTSTSYTVVDRTWTSTITRTRTTTTVLTNTMTRTRTAFSPPGSSGWNSTAGPTLDGTFYGMTASSVDGIPTTITGTIYWSIGAGDTTTSLTTLTLTLTRSRTTTSTIPAATSTVSALATTSADAAASTKSLAESLQSSSTSYSTSDEVSASAQSSTSGSNILPASFGAGASESNGATSTESVSNSAASTSTMTPSVSSAVSLSTIPTVDSSYGVPSNSIDGSSGSSTQPGLQPPSPLTSSTAKSSAGAITSTDTASGNTDPVSVSLSSTVSSMSSNSISISSTATNGLPILVSVSSTASSLYASVSSRQASSSGPSSSVNVSPVALPSTRESLSSQGFLTSVIATPSIYASQSSSGSQSSADPSILASATSLSGSLSTGQPSADPSLTESGSLSSTSYQTLSSTRNATSNVSPVTSQASGTFIASVLPIVSSADSTMTTSSTAASPTPSVCGEHGNFTLTFDDLPSFSPNQTVDITQAPPIFNGYHHMAFSNGYVYAPPPKAPFTPKSPPNLAVFLGNAAGNGSSNTPTAMAPISGMIRPGEFGDGALDSASALWFNGYSTWIGCDNAGPEPCTYVVTAYAWNTMTLQEEQIDTLNLTTSACPGFQNCQLEEVRFPSSFQRLSGLQIQAYKGAEQVMFFMDNVQLGWYNNTCAAGLQRLTSPRSGSGRRSVPLFKL